MANVAYTLDHPYMFQVLCGIRLGCTLSERLLAVALDPISRLLEGLLIHKEICRTCADETRLVISTVSQLQRMRKALIFRHNLTEFSAEVVLCSRALLECHVPQ